MGVEYFTLATGVTGDGGVAKQWKNIKSGWVVILGFDAKTAFVSAADTVSVKDPNGKVVDSMVLLIAANGELTVQSKKMLVPPNFTLVVTNEINFQGARADKFEEVRGFI